MNADELITFSNWLAERARQGGKVGIAMSYDTDVYEIAFSDGTGWTAGRVARAHDEAISQILKMYFAANNGLTFVTRSIPETVRALVAITNLEPEYLAQRFEGDLDSITFTLGTEFPPQTPIAAEATTAIIIWNSTMGRQPPAYLLSVAVPWQKLACNQPCKTTDGLVKWRVSYPELLTRVVAKYSHESLLMRECQSNDILTRLVEALKEVNEEADHAFAYDALRYAATGYDKDFFASRFGEPPAVPNEALDIIIPTVRGMVMTEYQDAAARGYAHTLYGRRLPIDRQPMSEVLWFILGGSVQDIVSVAQVTFSNNGGTVIPARWASDAEHIRVVGYIERLKEPDFTALLAQLAPLTAPLVPVPLVPTVVIE